MDPDAPSSGSLEETHYVDQKSLRLVSGKTADFDELARDCVCFANGAGGCIRIGIERDATRPPAEQRIDRGLLDRIRKRIGELTVNVEVLPEVVQDPSGGEYLALTVPRSVGVASTSDGRYFVRIGDGCQPIVGDDVLRLASDRPAVPWETMTSLGLAREDADPTKLARFVAGLRASDRVKTSVKEKADVELLEHYGLSVGGRLTNLGVLLLAKPSDRARLGAAPVVQAIRFDERGEKIGKHVWDDHTLSPVECIDAIWHEIPDFREAYEIPDGLLRFNIPAFDEVVVRELLVNALVHRPYTQRGDIFLNLHPDRLEVVNPGRLPLGVTPDNILHASRRRNDGLARVFHDLQLMEREGSGFDTMYERLLASGRAVPTVWEGTDSVHVVVPRRVVHPGVVRLLGEADKRFGLGQRERITLGLLAQTEGLAARELGEQLELRDPTTLASWLGRLLDLGLVERSGRTKGTRYFVPPGLLRDAGLDRATTLARMPQHRLQALVLEDLRRYPDSGRVDIHRRIGPEIPTRVVRRALAELVRAGKVGTKGERRWRTYHLMPSHDQWS